MCGNRLFNRKFVHLIDFNFSSFLVFLVCDLCSIFRICAFFFYVVVAQQQFLY